MKMPLSRLVVALTLAASSLFAQEPAPSQTEVQRLTERARELTSQLGDKTRDVAGQVGDKTREVAGQVSEKTREVATDLTEKTRAVADDMTQRARELAETEEARRASGAILEWIQAAEGLYKPWINWVLVTIGIALFISHGGQLLIGKLWGLVRGRGLDLGESLNDLLVTAFSGLALPAVLFIPVGKGAFIQSPMAVLSAAAVGMLFGIFLYTHGMKQEMLADKGEKTLES